jgi:hypothetical protein
MIQARTRFFSPLAVIVLLTGLTAPATAIGGTIYWNAGTVGGGGDLSPSSTTDVPSWVSAGPMSRGNYYNQAPEAFNNSTSASSSYSFNLNGSNTPASGSFNFGVNTVVGAALDTATTSYVSFTITPTSGLSFELLSIGFGTRSTANGPQAWTLRSSLDGFSTDLASGSISNNSAWSYKTASLGTPLSSSAATELRIYGYAVDTPQSPFSTTWRLDDVQVQIVPEPSTVLMLAIGVGSAAIAGGWRARSRRQLSRKTFSAS